MPPLLAEYAPSEGQQRHLHFHARLAFGLSLGLGFLGCVMVAVTAREFAWPLLLVGTAPAAVLWFVIEQIGRRTGRPYPLTVGLGLECFVALLPIFLAIFYLVRLYRDHFSSSLIFLGLLLTLFGMVIQYICARHSLRTARQQYVAAGLIEPELGRWSLLTLGNVDWEGDDYDDPTRSVWWRLFLLALAGIPLLAHWSGLVSGGVTFVGLLIFGGWSVALSNSARYFACAAEIRWLETEYDKLFLLPASGPTAPGKKGPR
jgi:hypothetical protein